MNKLSLRTKVLMFILLVTTSLLSIVGFGNYSAARDTILEALVDKADSKMMNVSSQLASWISTRRAEVEVMSRIDQVRYGTTEERLSYFRKEMAVYSSPFRSIGFADRNGNMIASNGKMINIGDEPNFYDVLDGKVVITDPLIGKASGASIIVIQVPVLGRDNRINGLVNATISADMFYNQQASVNIGDKDFNFIFYNDHGDVIEAPADNGLVKKTDSILSPNLPFQAYASEMLTADNGYFKLHGKQGESIFFYSAVKGTAWHMGLNVPVQDMNQPLTALKWRSIISIAIAEALLTAFLFLFCHGLVRRIKRILAVTEAAAAGSFEVVDIQDEGSDELSQLSNSVNQMKVRLSSMFNQLDAMINQNQFSFIVLDSEYRVTYFSKAAEQMLGYKAEEVLYSATALTFIDPQNIALEAERLSRKHGYTVPADLTVFKLLREENFSYEREWNYVRKDGTRIPVAHSSNGLHDRDGRFIGVIGSARDITQQKQAEMARSRQLKVMGAAKDLIATFDEQGRLLYINEAGQTLLGIDCLDMNDVNQVPLRTIAELLDGLDNARTNGYWENEALLRTLQGEFIPVSKILVVHRDDEDGEIFYSCIARDITEHKRVQLQLEQAMREAESANIAKSHFLAQISHEIRTPLAGIIGLTGLLQKTKLTSLQQDYLHKTWDSSQALLVIINDILDFSKMEAGKVELNEIQFDPYSMIQKLAEMLSVFVGGKERFQFIDETPKGLPQLLIGDCLRIEQILLNLCINAIKFTEQGSVILRLENLSEGDEDGSRVRIKFIVEDTGIGMSEEQLSKLFKPFVQADAETNRKYGGTGLGLVIVKRLVEMMGGIIRVKSELGQGSIFCFTLDLAVAEPPLENRFEINAGSEHSIWVVEDHTLMNERLCTVIQDSGFMPIAIPSWRNAYERLVRAGIGVLPFAILLDFEMPDMYGEETWFAMREAAKEAGVKTIALTTTFGREELLKQPLNNRPDSILVKPSTRVSLHRSLLALSGLPTETNAALTETAAAIQMPERMNGNILLAEDNYINQVVALEQLRDRGFNVDVAETGKQALHMIETKRYDLILMDIHMPEMDGDEVARIIRLDSKYDRLPIVALTANIMQQDHDRYMQLGMNDVLTKPISPEVLISVIDKWLRYDKELRVDAVKVKTKEREATAAMYMPIVNEDDEWLARGIPGLQLVEALQRVNGKRDILMHMLKLFVRDYRSFNARLQDMLAVGDYAAARRMAHTLKGVAGNLSAADLSAAAEVLEQLLKVSGESAPAPMKLAAATADVTKALNGLLGELTKGLTGFDGEF